MNIIDQFLSHYGWAGVALAGLALLTLCVQLRYQLFVYGRVPGYRNNRLRPLRQGEPAVSVIVPMFSEDESYVEERLPLLLAQEYAAFEVVIVYVGCDNDFFEDLQRIRQSFPNVVATKIEQNPRFPISPKTALNVGIKAAHYDFLIVTSTDARPLTNRWLPLMAKGFLRGDVVLGYCGVEPGHGFARRWMRTDRLMESAEWLSAAVRRHPYRGSRFNMGFTKELYFSRKGFNHLNMNIGEEDLFLRTLMTRDNVSIILSPRAATVQRAWGGAAWWTGERRMRDSARPFYPRRARWSRRVERWSRAGFFGAVAASAILMPVEFAAGAAALLVLRYAAAAVTLSRLSKRLGESGLRLFYPIYDLFSPLYDLWVCIVRLRRDERVWR